MNKLLLLCLVAMIGLSSCNRKVGAIFGKKKDKLEVVDPEFDYLSAKAKFNFDDGEKSYSTSANFRIKKDSLIWISFSPALGIEVARVLITTENVFILDKLKKEYYEYSYEELSKNFDFDFNFKMIQSVVLGNLVEPYKKQRVEKMDNFFTYTASKGLYLYQNFIGASTMKLEKVQVFDEGTGNTISVNYGDFILVNSQIFPNEISAVIDYEAKNKPNTEVNISYNKMVIEDGPISFPYSVPSKYEKK
ncbi:MAG: DUF4292 domain-containing protein [Ekhidna sp.]